MTKNMLKLNDSKTEVVLITPGYRANDIRIEKVQIGDSEVTISTNARNIGVIFDQHLNMNAHITAVIKSCMIHLLNIARIRPYIDQPSCETLIHALISSRIDYENSLLYGLPRGQIDRLQKVQNIAARIITKQRKYDHITPVLKSLHWLRVEHRILYKLLMITFKAIHGIAPIYLSEIISVNEQKRSLRQKNRMKLLSVPRFNTATYGRRAFMNAAPTEWNRLPAKLRTISEFQVFKPELKTF